MFKNKNVIVIIPARSGSKSIKNKNIRKFKGKPLIYHTIEYAIKSKIIDEVVVTTDSQKYINLIKKYNQKHFLMLFIKVNMRISAAPRQSVQAILL